MTAPAKPTVPEVLPLVQALYGSPEHTEGGGACCLHIVLDDGNVDDASVEFCRGVAEKAHHPQCYDLATTLLSMSTTQRRKLHAHADKRAALELQQPALPFGDDAPGTIRVVGGALIVDPHLPPFPAPWVELQRDEGPDHQTLVAVLEPPQSAALLRVRTVTRVGVSETLASVSYPDLRWIKQALSTTTRTSTP